MKAAAQDDRYKTIDQMAKLAVEHGIDLKADTFVELMIKTTANDYKLLSRINKIANKHGIKLCKEHLSHLLAYVASLFYTHSTPRVDIVIKFTTSLKFELDAEYFETGYFLCKSKKRIRHQSNRKSKKILLLIMV